MDYWKVSALMEPDPYHMPQVDERVKLVGEAHFLTKIDIMNGYYQIPVIEQANQRQHSVYPGENFIHQDAFGPKNAPWLCASE